MTLPKIVMLSGIFMLTACSHSSSQTTVQEIHDMPVPVVHPQNTASTSPSEVANYFSENADRLSKLRFTLKSDLGDDVQPSEIFDTHSDAHRVYVALSKLEQVSSMNESYRKEGNLAGLKAINEMLKPISTPA